MTTLIPKAKFTDFRPDPGKQPDDARAGRYRLQRIAAGLIYRAGAPRQERLCTCQRRRKGESVRVVLDRQTGRASYNGLESCSNVWACPVCSRIITEHRRAELQAAINAWVKRGGEVYLMTLTMPHVRADSIDALLVLLRAAAQRLKQSKLYRSITAEVGRIGNIRALELTWGSWHGWHPHFHELIFARRGQLAALRRLERAWIDALLKVGAAGNDQVNDMLQAAFDVQNGDFAAEYVAKFGHEPEIESKLRARATWGAASEMTRGQAKIARTMRGRTPFTLLIDYENGNTQAGALFREFYAGFHGQRQLYWSPGLRARLELDQEKPDEALTADELNTNAQRCVQVATLDAADWHTIIAHDARYRVLLYAERYGAYGVAAMLQELRMRKATHHAGMTGPPR